MTAAPPALVPVTRLKVNARDELVGTVGVDPKAMGLVGSTETWRMEPGM